MSKNEKNYRLTTRYKAQSQRQLKVSQSIRSSLIECFRREGKLDTLLQNTPLSITEVNISPDLRVTNCFFVPFNTDLSIDKILQALHQSRYVIRNFVTKQVNLKYSPEIRFYFDKSINEIEEVEKLLNK